MNEEEAQKLLDAFNRLRGESDELAEQLKKNIAQQDLYTVAVKKANDTVDKEILERLKLDASLVRGQQVYEQQMRSLGLTKNALGEFERATVTLTSQQRKRLAEEEVITNRQKARDEMSAKYHSMLADKTGTLIKGLEDFGSGLNKTIFDSTKGSSKYGEMMEGFGDGIQAATSNLGPFGKAVGFAASGLFKLVGAAFKQQEQLNKAYETLSQFGAVDVSGIDGMFKTLQKTGFTVADIDKFTDVIKNASSNLATMGTTAAEGASKFAQTLKAARDTGVEEQLRMLGFNSETMAKTFADYQGMMARTGMLQEKDGRKLSRQSAEYAQTLDQLAKLTGATRDELQKRADADANDLKYRLQLQDLQKKDPEIYKKVRDTTMLAGEMGEETVSGLREMIAGGGQVIGDASAKLSLATNGAAEAITQDLLEGRITAVEANQRLAKAINSTVDTYRDQFKLSNDISAGLGISAKQIDGANKLQTKGQAELEQIIEEQQKQGAGELDNERKAEVARQIAERNAQQARDRLNNLVGKELVGAFEKLMKVINGFAKKLAEIIAKFGGPDFTDLFVTEADIKDDLKKTSAELEKNNKRMEEINKASQIHQSKLKELEQLDAKEQELQLQYRKATTKEEKAQLNEQLKNVRVDRVKVQSEMRQAGQDMARGKSEIPRLEQQKKELLSKQDVSQTKLEQMGGDVKPLQNQAKFLEKMSGAGITDPRAQANILAQIKAESGGVPKSENLNYSPEQLLKTFPKYVSDLEDAKKLVAQGPEAVGNRIYGSRMGNEGEGYKYRGRGLIQLTGKDNYAKFGKLLGIDLVENPDLANDPEIAQQLAIEYFKQKSKDKDLTDIEQVGKAVGYVDIGGRETQKRAGYAESFLKQIQTAQEGGLLSGPESGYPVLMHGKELVIPMPNTGNLASTLDSVTKTPLSEAAPSAGTNTASGPSMDQFMSLQTDLMNMISSKLDALENRLAKSNDIQENILTYSMG